MSGLNYTNYYGPISLYAKDFNLVGNDNITRGIKVVQFGIGKIDKLKKNQYNEIGDYAEER
jgi:hypothetical protein